jgi:tRNA (5-methylaminomethyl-2-thiouridylate)-methyltransferase (EC 2.1.1.61)
LGKSFACRVKIRQNHKPAPATVLVQSNGEARIEFEIPQRAVAPGQSAVLYSDDGLVLGGGIIDEAIPDEDIEE